MTRRTVQEEQARLRKQRKKAQGFLSIFKKPLHESLTSVLPIMLIVLALGALSVHITGFDFGVLVKKGSKFFDILAAMFPPNTGYLSKIWQPLWDTIKMSFLLSLIHI